MPFRLSDENIDKFLHLSRGATPATIAAEIGVPYKSVDVFIAGSGPIACTYARIIHDADSSASLMIAEIGSQDHPIIGAHHKNSVKYQKDIDAFVNVIKGALQPISVPPGDTLQTTLARAAWAPPLEPPISDPSAPPMGSLVIQGHNPNQHPGKNLRATAVTRTVGGMSTHWTCACPLPHTEERVNCPISEGEFNELLDRSAKLLNVHDDQYDHSIRHTVVKEALGILSGRDVRNLPLGVQRRSDNSTFVTWTGANTILGSTVESPNFTLMTEARVTKLLPHAVNPQGVGYAVVRDLNNNSDVLIEAKAFVIACGAIGTPQILWNSGIRPDALGRYLSEQSMAFCQIVLKHNIIDSIPDDPRFAERVRIHRKNHPNDPLPITFTDPEPQIAIPYSSTHPWHVQVHRDAFSYGDVGPKSDPRVVVDLRFFGKSEISRENRVTFGKEPWPRSSQEARGWKAGITDIYGMPQPTFEVVRSDDDGKRDQRMMNDMTNVANILGGYLPGSYPQFLEPGLALHITGTTRIGKDPKTSVADPESRVHGFDNLWVGGNGCIPDATASNPTRTSVAYAIKGAEAIHKYLASSRSEAL